MGRQCIIIAIYSVDICVKTMATLKETVNETHDWSLYRISELCSYGEIENVMDGNALRQEFDEWITSYNKDSEEEIISLAYIGEGGEYDI